MFDLYLSFTRSYVGFPAGDEEMLNEAGVRHVQFTAAEGMEASIPLHKALNTCTSHTLEAEV
jgi:hypothetical protein